MKKVLCSECSKSLSKDEIALNRKLIDIDTKEFLCLNCLSVNLGCTNEDLEIKISEFKEQGCSLFM